MAVRQQIHGLWMRTPTIRQFGIEPRRPSNKTPPPDDIRAFLLRETGYRHCVAATGDQREGKQRKPARHGTSLTTLPFSGGRSPVAATAGWPEDDHFPISGIPSPRQIFRAMTSETSSWARHSLDGPGPGIRPQRVRPTLPL